MPTEKNLSWQTINLIVKTACYIIYLFMDLSGIGNRFMEIKKSYNSLVICIFLNTFDSSL